MLITVTLLLGFAGSACGQSSATQPKEVAAVEPKPDKPESKISPADSRPATRPNDLLTEVESLKAENAAVRELLRRMEEQQKALLEQVDRLQRRLDGVPTAELRGNAQSEGPP